MVGSIEFHRRKLHGNLTNKKKTNTHIHKQKGKTEQNKCQIEPQTFLNIHWDIDWKQTKNNKKKQKINNMERYESWKEKEKQIKHWN